NSPEPPHSLSGGSLVRVEESSNAFIASGNAGNHQVLDHQRRGGGAIVLPPVSHLHIPEQIPGETVKRNQMRMVSHHKNFVPEDRHTTVDRPRSIADQTFCQGALIAPN